MNVVCIGATTTVSHGNTSNNTVRYVLSLQILNVFHISIEHVLWLLYMKIVKFNLDYINSLLNLIL